MYTANTMASAIEALGMAVPYSSSIPAWDPLLNGGAGGLHPEKIDECERASVALQTCIANDIKPRDIMTMKVHIRISYVYAYAYAYAYVCESARRARDPKRLIYVISVSVWRGGIMGGGTAVAQ